MESMVNLDQYAYNMMTMLTRLGQHGWTIVVNQKNNGFVITHPRYKDTPIKDIARVAFMCESYANNFIYVNEDNWIKPQWEAVLIADKVTIKLN